MQSPAISWLLNIIRLAVVDGCELVQESFSNYTCLTWDRVTAASVRGSLAALGAHRLYFLIDLLFDLRRQLFAWHAIPHGT